MKKLIKLKCTNCNANLSVEEKREFLFCEYCGTKLILDNENEHIYRHIDEAEVKRAETEQLIKLKELEIAEKRHEENKQKLKFKIIITFIGILLGIIGVIIGSNSENEDHWGYLVALTMMCFIPWMWIGPKIFEEDSKKK